MSKFVFLYHAPVPPAEATPPTPGEIDAVMQQWGAWAAIVGERMVDFGTPPCRWRARHSGGHDHPE